MRALTIRGWSTLGALLVLAAVILATVSTTLGSRPAAQPASVAQAALVGDVDRCSHGGEAAMSDPDCQAAWRRSGEQFLRGRSSGARR
jgi:conjugative transfer region protein TrbK